LEKEIAFAVIDSDDPHNPPEIGGKFSSDYNR
jgi:hypothetical protein